MYKRIDITYNKFEDTTAIANYIVEELQVFSDCFTIEYTDQLPEYYGTPKIKITPAKNCDTYMGICIGSSGSKSNFYLYKKDTITCYTRHEQYFNTSFFLEIYSNNTTKEFVIIANTSGIRMGLLRTTTGDYLPVSDWIFKDYIGYICWPLTNYYTYPPDSNTCYLLHGKRQINHRLKWLPI